MMTHRRVRVAVPAEPDGRRCDRLIAVASEESPIGVIGARVEGFGGRWERATSCLPLQRVGALGLWDRSRPRAARNACKLWRPGV